MEKCASCGKKMIKSEIHLEAMDGSIVVVPSLKCKNHPEDESVDQDLWDEALQKCGIDPSRLVDLF